MARKERRSRQGYSVGRTTYGQKGAKRKRETSRWYARFKDHAGQWHRLPAFSDHDASLELARRLRRSLRATKNLPQTCHQRVVSGRFEVHFVHEPLKWRPQFNGPRDATTSGDPATTGVSVMARPLYQSAGFAPCFAGKEVV